jgi:polar amino acid transport system permease protein
MSVGQDVTPAAVGSAPGGASGRPARSEVPPIVTARHPWRWVAAAVVLAILAAVVTSMVRNKNFGWNVVGSYFTSTSVLQGLELTIWLTALVMVLGYIIGAVLAAMRLSPNPVLQVMSWTYVWLFRSVPLLVQLLFWYNIGALYRSLEIGIPYGPELASFKTVNLVAPVAAAIIGLTLHEAAYAAEILRGGIVSVDRGQTEAAKALGLGRWRTFRRIVLPQAMRFVVPATANAVINTLKATAIVSVIAVADLLYSVEIIYNRNYLIIPLLLVATIWYVVVTSVLGVVQYGLERHYGRGFGPAKSGGGRWAALRRGPDTADQAGSSFGMEL